MTPTEPVEIQMTPQEAYKAGLQCGPSDETRAIACQDPVQALYYARDVDQCPRDDTRRAVIGSPAHASLYAFYVDCGPRDDTREAASDSTFWRREYEKMFPVKGS
jgi:hypothetical protein